MAIRIPGPFLVVCVLFSGLALAEDWTMYRGTEGNGKSPESFSDVNWKNGPKKIWETDTHLGFSSFTVVDGKAFTLVTREHDNEQYETCIALDAQTGEQLWSTPLAPGKYDGGGNAGTRNNRGGDGPRSTPVSDGTHVYVYDASLGLHCLNISDGSVLWNRDIVKEFNGRNIHWNNATSPILHGNRIYVAGGGAGQSFLAFDKTTGKAIWKSGDETLTHATPTLATINDTLHLIFFMRAGLIGIDVSNGKELWRAKFPFRVSTAASPVVSGNLVYVSAGYGVGAGLFEIEADFSVNEKWTQPNRLINHWSTPVVHDGHLYGLYDFKKYGKAPLQCVELATGDIKWTEYGFGPGNCILVGAKLVVLADNGDIAVVEASPDGYRELARAGVLKGKCWSTPAYSEGRLYVRSTQQAACLDMESP